METRRIYSTNACFFDKKGNYFMVVGLANVEMTKNLQVFRKMAESLEPK